MLCCRVDNIMDAKRRAGRHVHVRLHQRLGVYLSVQRRAKHFAERARLDVAWREHGFRRIHSNVAGAIAGRKNIAGRKHRARFQKLHGAGSLPAATTIAATKALAANMLADVNLLCPEHDDLPLRRKATLSQSYRHLRSASRLCEIAASGPAGVERGMFSLSSVAQWGGSGNRR